MAFLLVAQHRSFSRAAGALFITPSGLSVLIRELETQLGVRLFDRTTRHVALTPFGTELVAVAQRSLKELDGVISRIGRSAKEAGVSLSVGSPPLLMASVLAPAIKEFRSYRPELRFQLFDGDRFIVVGQYSYNTRVAVEVNNQFRRTYIVCIWGLVLPKLETIGRRTV